MKTETKASSLGHAVLSIQIPLHRLLWLSDPGGLRAQNNQPSTADKEKRAFLLAS